MSEIDVNTIAMAVTSEHGENKTEQSAFALRAFPISIVVAMYNVENYLEETLESVLDQDIGFIQNIQLVLVDDGSTDSTLEIACGYQRRYPHNVVVSVQEHAGVSVARRNGLALAQGAIVNFLDADDKWSPDACRVALAFFEEHPDVAFCAAKLVYFDAQTGDHPLAYKFETTRVVDVRMECDCPQLSLSSTFVQRFALSSALFDERLSFSEDCAVVNRILLKFLCYGVLSGPAYLYRRRADNSSAISGARMSKSWYLDTPRYCYEALFDESEQMYGLVMPFLQYTVMYDLQWRIKKRHGHPLGKCEYDSYCTTIVSLLRRIDDNIIAAQRNLDVKQKVLALALKFGWDYERARRCLAIEDDNIVFVQSAQKSLVLAPSVSQRLVLCSIAEQGEEVVVDMLYDSAFPPEEVKLEAIGEGFSVLVGAIERPDCFGASFFVSKYGSASGFSVRIPGCDVRFNLIVKGAPLKVSLFSGKHCALSLRAFGYIKLGKNTVLVKRGVKNTLLVRHTSVYFDLKREILWERSLLGRDSRTKSLISLRRRALLKKRTNGRGQKIWLIFDRTYMAGDNGEALFAYLQKHPVPGVRSYFVINRDCPDFERMKAIGPVVAFGSSQHELLHLLADKIISSAADDYITNRFGRYRYIVHGIESYDFVFLQHGVIQNDMSVWLNRPAKNIALFCTSAQAERNSILDTPSYGYDEAQVVLTGMPRHDVLLDTARRVAVERKVLIAPTWRHDITSESDPKTGLRRKNPRFRESEYWVFFNALINDSRLASAAKRLSYSVEFLIHPAFIQEANEFSSDFCDVLTMYDYRNELASSAILVTDWSSIAFDFALLKKPLVYAQFDYDTFYSSHLWDRGYFDCARDGFGDVCFTLDETVEAVIKLMESPVIRPEYEKRVEAFFGEQPSCRCQAVIDAIVDIDRRCALLNDKGDSIHAEQHHSKSGYEPSSRERAAR